MGLMDSILGALTGGKGGTQAAIIGAATELLTKQGGGGLQGLVQKFEAAGMGDMIKGWISTGPNPAISPEQVQAALGSDMVQGLAQKAGLNPEELLKGLSAQLPQLIDKLTPDGAAPDENALGASLGELMKKFKA